MIELEFGPVRARITGETWWASDHVVAQALALWQERASRDPTFWPDRERHFAELAAEELGGRIVDLSAHEAPKYEPGVIY